MGNEFYAAHKTKMLWEHAKLKAKEKREEPVTHDYRNSKMKWGWAITDIYETEKEGVISLMGIGLGIQTGDFFLVDSNKGEAKLEITEIEYKRNPVDMWEATAVVVEQAIKETNNFAFVLSCLWKYS